MAEEGELSDIKQKADQMAAAKAVEVMRRSTSGEVMNWPEVAERLVDHLAEVYARYETQHRYVEKLRADDARRREALEIIIRLTSGDKIPRWVDQNATSATRGQILDICSGALLEK